MTTRKNGKRFPQLKNLHVWIIFVVLMLFSLLALTKLNSLFQTNTVDSTSYGLGEKVDKNDDGVYENYKHGYKFSYPTSILIQTYAGADGATFDSKSLTDFGDSKEYMRVSVSYEGNTWNDYYENLDNAKVGDVINIKNSYSQKLAEKVYDDYRLITVLTKTNNDAQTDPTISYTATWLKNNHEKVIINMFSNLRYENFLRQNKIVFDNIAESFEFF